MRWKWNRGAATDLADFADPLATHDYAACLYDVSGTVVLEGTAPAGGTCGTRPCWKALGAQGFIFKAPAGSTDGLRKLSLRPGAAGVARVFAQAQGPKLFLPRLPLGLPLTFEAQGNGQCWGATYGAGGVIRNDSLQLKALGS